MHRRAAPPRMPGGWSWPLPRRLASGGVKAQQLVVGGGGAGNAPTGVGIPPAATGCRDWLMPQPSIDRLPSAPPVRGGRGRGAAGTRTRVSGLSVCGGGPLCRRSPLLWSADVGASLRAAHGAAPRLPTVAQVLGMSGSSARLRCRRLGARIAPWLAMATYGATALGKCVRCWARRWRAGGYGLFAARLCANTWLDSHPVVCRLPLRCRHGDGAGAGGLRPDTVSRGAAVL